MPRVITEALDEPDVVVTFLVLALACLAIAWAVGGRYGRPRWLVALALLSVAAIIAATVVPQGGWSFLMQGYSEPIAECLGLDAWRGVVIRPIEADTLLNVALFIPAGFLWATMSAGPSGWCSRSHCSASGSSGGRRSRMDVPARPTT